jgi:hypothetical protein
MMVRCELWRQAMKREFLMAMVLAFGLLPGAAGAKDLPAKGMTIDEVVSWLQGAGYMAQIQTGKDGVRNIYSSAEGTNFHIYFYDCKQDRCGSIQFSTGINTNGAFPAQRVNDWSAKSRWVRAYSDKVNDPWMEYDVDLTPGGTYELLNDEFAIWRNGLRRFSAFIGGKDDPQ